MLIADVLIVAGALGAGVFIGADCVKLSARAKIAEAVGARDRAIVKVEDLAGDLFDAEVERNKARLQTVEAHDAVGAVSARLAQAHHDLELAEEDLALSHVEAARLRLALLLLAAENVRLRADPPWMQQPITAFHRPLPEGSVVVPGPGYVS